MSGRTEPFEILLTSAGGHVTVPSWARSFSHSTLSALEVRSLGRLPAMTIVEAEDLGSVLRHRAFLQDLATLHAHDTNAKIVFTFRKQAPADVYATPRSFSRLLGFFARTCDVELAQGSSGTLLAVQEALARRTIQPQERSRPANAGAAPSEPLLGVKKILEATAALRSPKGRLDAARVAKALGLTVAELAGLLGRTRQAVSKTPDAESLQERLRSFERVVRLRTVLSDGDFRGWLNLANAQLDGHSPLYVIRRRRVTAVADLVEDMLTGAST
jgi:hypothetical protein